MAIDIKTKIANLKEKHLQTEINEGGTIKRDMSQTYQNFDFKTKMPDINASKTKILSKNRIEQVESKKLDLSNQNLDGVKSVNTSKITFQSYKN